MSQLGRQMLVARAGSSAEGLPAYQHQSAKSLPPSTTSSHNIDVELATSSSGPLPSIQSTTSAAHPPRSTSRLSHAASRSGSDITRMDRPGTPEDPDLIKYRKELASINRRIQALQQVAGRGRTCIKFHEELTVDPHGKTVRVPVTASEKYLRYKKMVKTDVVLKVSEAEDALRTELWEKYSYLLEHEDKIISDNADHLGSPRTIDHLQQQRRNMVARRINLEVTRRSLNEWALNKRLQEEVDRSISIAREKKRRARLHARMAKQKQQDPRSARRYSVMSNFSRRRESNASAISLADFQQHMNVSRTSQANKLEGSHRGGRHLSTQSLSPAAVRHLGVDSAGSSAPLPNIQEGTKHRQNAGGQGGEGTIGKPTRVRLAQEKPGHTRTHSSGSIVVNLLAPSEREGRTHRKRSMTHHAGSQLSMLSIPEA